VAQTAPLDYLSPLWLFVATVAVLLGAVESGYRLGRHRRGTGAQEEIPAGTIGGATLVLLAFVLAFTFGLAATRYDSRRDLLQQEANAIGTTYLRTSFVPEPGRGELRARLRDYTNARVEWTMPGRLQAAIRRSEALHRELWAEAERVATSAQDPELMSLFIQSLNETIDLHAKRKAMALWAHIPITIWIALYVVAILTMATMGYHAGVTGAHRSLAGIAFVLSFAVIMLLIADLDDPYRGLLRADDRPLLDLRQSLPAR
jgi:hypothetical protein